MPGTPTTLGFAKPTPGGDRNSWGALWNGNADLTDKLHRTGLIIGEIRMWPLSTAPSISSGGTWLVCDGSHKSKADFSELFGVLGTSYGTPAGGLASTHFLLPDLKARVPVGYNASTIADSDSSDTDGFPNDVRSARAIGDSGGEESHVLVASEAPTLQHTHTVDTYDIGDTDPRTHSSNTASKTDTRSTGITMDNASTGIRIQRIGLGSDSGQTASYQLSDRGDADNVGLTTYGINDPQHKHTLNETAHDHDIPSLNHDHTLSLTLNTTDLGQDQAHNTMQPFLVVNFIIFAKYPT